MKTIALIAALAAASLMSVAHASEAIVTKAGCVACHAKDKKLVGPGFKMIADKYKGDAGALAMLTEKVRKGGSGVWGPIPMPANSPEKISDADLKAAVEWILKGAN